MSDEIRVSCSGLVYPVVDDKVVGHYSMSKLARDPPKWFMTPYGGKNAFHANMRKQLEAWGAREEDPDAGHLALFMPRDSLDEFKEWFYTREGREVTPLRELAEELVDEQGLFGSRDIKYGLSNGFNLEKVTERAGGGVTTHYFFDVFRLTLEGADEVFRAANENQEAYARALTPEEIASGKMQRAGPENGAEVGDMFQYFGKSPEELARVVQENAASQVSVRMIPSTYGGIKLPEKTDGLEFLL